MSADCTALGVAIALLALFGFVVLRAYQDELARRLRVAASPPPSAEPGEHVTTALGAPLVILLAPPRATRHPIVLAHGYFGFDSIGVSRVRREYFRGVRERLETLGHAVHVVRLSPAAGIELRAAQLARQIERLGEPRVNVIAHSMGGLDARYAIARLGLAPRVASLTTVGTPHRGTPIADRALAFGEWRRTRRVLSTIGANLDGIYDLTTDRMAAFNDAVVDASGVLYASVVGAVQARDTRVHALLAPTFAYLSRASGPNDGVVPADSQRWGEVLAEVDADHWAQIGWSSGFDAALFYVTIAERLAARGL